MPPPRMFDAHCHLQDERISSPRRGRMITRARRLRVIGAVSCASFEREWQLLGDLLHRDDLREFVVPCFGLHPWFVNEASEKYLVALRQKLMDFPRASLGEIGFCKSFRGKKVPMQAQETAFRDQFRLASELHRSVVIHCVGAYGKLLSLMQEMMARGSNACIPCCIVLHSFGGAKDLVPSFLALEKIKVVTSQSSDATHSQQHQQQQRLRVFFSFNARQLDSSVASNQKAIQSLRRVPLQSLLLETDAPDHLPVVSADEKDRIHALLQSQPDEEEEEQREGDMSKLNEPLWVQLALIRAAKLLNMSEDQLATQVVENTKAAFRL